MIIDTFENITNYKGAGRVYTALEFAAKTDFLSMPLGKYELDGKNIFYMVQEYDTKPFANVAEAHDKYIDIQFIVSGEEIIGYAPRCCDKKLLEEHPEDDYSLFECKVEFLELFKGNFMVFYPNDIHSPGIMKNAPVPCKKVVFKIKAE
ncbi:MAG: YhcH/YjgK/YiaL family protein [Clostridia bacterium]|nr:YhcH/YjgK/YiaL family protein [Clostridia bacterium]